MPALAYLLTNQDDEVLADACWALSYLSDGDETQIQAVIDAGVVPAVVRLLGSPATLVVTPALRTMGNIVSGSEAQTQVAIDALARAPRLSEVAHDPHGGVLGRLQHCRGNRVPGRRARHDARDAPRGARAGVRGGQHARAEGGGVGALKRLL